MTCDGILGNDCPRFWEAAIIMYYIFQEISLLIPHISFGITCTLVEHFIQLLSGANCMHCTCHTEASLNHGGKREVEAAIQSRTAEESFAEFTR